LFQLAGQLLSAHAVAGEKAARAGILRQKVVARLVVRYTFILLDVGINDVGGQVSSINGRIVNQQADESRIRPTQSGFGFLGSHGVMRVGLKRGVDFQLAHQAGVHANQVELFDTGVRLDLGERLVKLVQVDGILLERVDDGRAAAVWGSRRRIAPAAGPTHAVVGHDEHIAVGWIILYSPGNKVHQRVAVRHVHFAQVHQQV